MEKKEDRIDLDIPYKIFIDLVANNIEKNNSKEELIELLKEFKKKTDIWKRKI